MFSLRIEPLTWDLETWNLKPCDRHSGKGKTATTWTAPGSGFGQPAWQRCRDPRQDVSGRGGQGEEGVRKKITRKWSTHGTVPCHFSPSWSSTHTQYSPQSAQRQFCSVLQILHTNIQE